MLQEFGTQRLIANLGHGMNPDHDPARLQVFLEAVHEVAIAMNSEQQKKKTKISVQAQTTN